MTRKDKDEKTIKIQIY